jgi:biopolymer transport protein ExbB
MNILSDNIIFKGGWVMIPIITGSIIALGLSIERFVFFSRIRTNVDEFAKEIFFLLSRGEISHALDKCRSSIHPVAAVFSAGIENADEDLMTIERSMEREGNRQISIIEKNFFYIMVIVGVEPMLGFLGTIWGLIQAFMTWEKFSASVTVDQLAAGIYQAMITTAGGLIVAIPFYIIYHYLTNKANKMASDLNYYGDKVVILLNAKKEAGVMNEN